MTFSELSFDSKRCQNAFDTLGHRSALPGDRLLLSFHITTTGKRV